METIKLKVKELRDIVCPNCEGKGGLASSKKLTPQQRKERATKAVQAREAKRASGGTPPHH